MPTSNASQYVKFLVYLVVVVLINLVGLTLFARIDLTRNELFSLSAASRQTVASLSEPLTIKVFFTRDLPAPHNGTERYLHDLLAEYARHAGRHFNYRFYDVSPDEGDTTAEAEENRRLARNYGIQPVQIQAIERDEVKFQNAYMGLVMIHGDIVERLDAITSTDGLEYRITTAIQKMNNKISALLALKGEIQVEFFLSPSLVDVAPLMGLEGLSGLEQIVARTVERLNGQHYNKLRFQAVTPPTDADRLAALGRERNILTLQWPAVPKHQVAAGRGGVGLVLRHGDRHLALPLIQVVKLPIFGTQYQMAGESDLERMLTDGIEALIDINADLGVLAGKGTLPLTGPPSRDPRQPPPLETLRSLLTQSYTLQPVDVAEKAVSPGIETLLVLRPTETFSDWELYQIDQFLMRGGSLFVALDAFAESQAPGQMPNFRPVDTGLEKLLAHWGVEVIPSIVLDEKCYRQRVPRDMGGGERVLYFAPLIENRQTNDRLPFMHNIRGLVALQASPLKLDAERLTQQGLEGDVLFSSSERSWQMRAPINLNPMFLSAPPAEEMDGPHPLAVLVEGRFESYFKDKPMPVRETAESEIASEADAGGAQPSAPAVTGVADTGSRLDRSRPARLFVMAGSKMITDTILDPDGRTPNSIFTLNTVDYLNGRTAVARMRSKEQRFNPLDPAAPETKALIKGVNIVGLPVLVVCFGLSVWWRRARRKKRIQMMFEH